MVRHFILSDLDGANPRHVTLAQYTAAIDRGEKFQISGLLGKLFAVRNTPKAEEKTLSLAYSLRKQREWNNADSAEAWEKFRISGLLGELVVRPTHPLCKPVLGSPDAWRG